VKSRFSALTKEAFDRFLNWIGPTVSHSGEQYVLLQRKLEMYFAGRGCGEFASDLASQTLDRAAVKFSEGDVNEGSEPSKYIFGVARYILIEHQRRPRPLLLVLDNVSSIASHTNTNSAKLTCFKQCLNRLPEEDRVLLRDYYLGTTVGEAKRLRAEVAGDLRVRQGALRVRVFRTKQKLIQCIAICATGESSDFRMKNGLSHYA